MHPININQDGTILSGHARAMKLKEMGEIEVDVYVPDRVLTPKQEEEILIRANANTAGKWDWDLLTNDFDLGELDDWGLEVPDLELDTEEPEVEEDEVPEVKKDPFVKRGDLWELNEHRLMCGDSLNETDTSNLMNGELATLAHNDPPYGMKKEKDGVKNDNLNYDDLLEFNKDWINLQFTYLKENGSWYCWGIDEPLMDIYSNIIKPLIKTQKATFRNLITWNKGSSGKGQESEKMRCYPPADEKCLFVMCGVQGFNYNADNYFEGFEPIRKYLDDERIKLGWTKGDYNKILNATNKSQHHLSQSYFGLITKQDYQKLQDYCKTNNNDAFKKEYDEIKKEYDELKKEYDELKKEYYSTRAYFNNTHDNMTNVWNIERTNQQEREQTGGHATPKPLKLCSRVIKSSSREKDLVIDFFLGSGSTLIACQQTKRKCYGMELDEHYCSVIITRWLNYMIKEGKEISLKCNGEVVDYKNILK
jgi:DNA modification methylase